LEAKAFLNFSPIRATKETNMNEVEKKQAEEKDVIAELITLHSRIESQLKQTLPDIIRSGELLTQQKKKIGHGNFTRWINDNLPYSDRTARNWMRVYRKRDTFKTETVSSVTSAYQLLTEHKAPKPPMPVTDLLGRECEYNEETRRAIFDSDVEWFVYEFPLDMPVKSDEELYQDLAKRFAWREEKHGIPNTLSREVYESIKFSALKEIEHQVERFEKQMEEFAVLGDNDDPAKKWIDEQRSKDLRLRWAYMEFIGLLAQMDKLTIQGQKAAGPLIEHYREMWVSEDENKKAMRDGKRAEFQGLASNETING